MKDSNRLFNIVHILLSLANIYLIVIIIIAIESNTIELNDKPTVNGEYSPSKKVILLYPTRYFDRDDFESAAYHEVCHYIWHEKLNITLKNEYLKIHKDSEKFVTKYSRKNEREDFAEHCSYFLRNQTQYLITKERCDFFEKYLTEVDW